MIIADNLIAVHAISKDIKVREVNSIVIEIENRFYSDHGTYWKVINRTEELLKSKKEYEKRVKELKRKETSFLFYLFTSKMPASTEQRKPLNRIQGRVDRANGDEP